MFPFQVQMELRKIWYRLCQRPDPVYIQQRQYLVDAYWQRCPELPELKEPRVGESSVVVGWFD
ncbi:hypothetical protein DPMN_063779 [Dreissena polymorpha]|uniref:Uncharacterized protein n=1 Tax=Dreissena polymorpha TaxID=45954 RepID=A0A9D4CCE4_DREPO|nr:hypothetical protein DPMN_063779 [Dreissena polymorpha]